jgi:hypothetical protein
VLEARVAELTAECEQLRVSYERALAYELAQAATVTLAMAKAAGAGGAGGGGAFTPLEIQVGGSAQRVMVKKMGMSSRWDGFGSQFGLMAWGFERGERGREGFRKVRRGWA